MQNSYVIVYTVGTDPIRSRKLEAASPADALEKFERYGYEEKPHTVLAAMELWIADLAGIAWV